MSWRPASRIFAAVASPVVVTFAYHLVVRLREVYTRSWFSCRYKTACYLFIQPVGWVAVFKNSNNLKIATF
jgi:hypothetical protein